MGDTECRNGGQGRWRKQLRICIRYPYWGAEVLLQWGSLVTMATYPHYAEQQCRISTIEGTKGGKE